VTRSERGIGIALGLVLGVAIVVLFVFLGSDDTIDAPSLEGTTTIEREAPPPQEAPATTPTQPGPPED
jgi:hypothetical protein